MTDPNLTIEAMVVAAREHGVADAEVARELASNAFQAIADDPAPAATLTDMINHRRFHWPALWRSFSGSPRTLAAAMVRAYRDAR